MPTNKYCTPTENDIMSSLPNNRDRLFNNQILIKIITDEIFKCNKWQTNRK